MRGFLNDLPLHQRDPEVVRGRPGAAGGRPEGAGGEVEPGERRDVGVRQEAGLPGPGPRLGHSDGGGQQGNIPVRSRSLLTILWLWNNWENVANLEGYIWIFFF